MNNLVKTVSLIANNLFIDVSLVTYNPLPINNRLFNETSFVIFIFLIVSRICLRKAHLFPDIWKNGKLRISEIGPTAMRNTT